MGAKQSFTGTRSGDKVAPIPDLPALTPGNWEVRPKGVIDERPTVERSCC